MNEVYSKLKEFGKVRINEPLSKHTTFKIGGPADFFVIVENTENLVSLLNYLDGKNLNYFIFGGGSNVLISDEGYRGVVIYNRTKNCIIQNSILEAESGCTLVEVARKAIQANLSGLEWGVGVPGTVGGAVRGNAGAMGGEIKDNLVSVEIYRNGETVELTKEECDFVYRGSILKKNKDVILKASFKLDKGVDSELLKKSIEYLQHRAQTQPQGFASAGSIFKNVILSDEIINTNEKVKKLLSSSSEQVNNFLQKKIIPAGWLVESVNAKSMKVGGAMVSEKHANFIVNLGECKCSDVLLLVEKIKQRVYDNWGLDIEEEIQVINS